MNARRALLSLVAIAALTAGLLIGLSTGAPSPGRADTTPPTTTSVTVPEPVVTTVTQPTKPPQTLPGASKTVFLGVINTPEQFIIGELYELALEQQGYKVVFYRNLGVLSQALAALQSHQVDVYPEYLGVWNSSVAHLHRRFRTLHESLGAARRYAGRHGFVLLPPTPFSDTSCVAVLSQYAAANHVYSIPQLARGGPVIFGAPLAFQTDPDGIPALEQSYHLSLTYVQTIGDTLQYGWLGTGNVQAAYCSTTDPKLIGPKYVLLRDPKSVFGHGNVVPVTTPYALRVEGRAFATTIEKVDSLLTLRAIRGLNAEYQLGGHTEKQTAEEFLEGNGLLPKSRYAPVPTTTSTSSTSSTG